MEPYLLIPLGTGFVYTLGALCLKRSTNDGVGPWRTTFVSNLFIFAIAQVFWFLGDPIESFSSLWVPFLISILFFLGQLATCFAIHKGDVSVVTPILGTKPVFIGLISVVVFSQSLSTGLWIAALLSSVAVFLLRGSTHAEKKRLLPSILIGIAGSFSYSISDTLMGVYGAEIGFENLIAVSFSLIGLWSLSLIPFFSSPFSTIPKRSKNWLYLGSAFLALQGAAMAFAVISTGKATTMNILYSSRGIWSILLVWLIGHWFSNQEKHLGAKILIRRLIGSLLLVVAIVLAIG